MHEEIFPVSKMTRRKKDDPYAGRKSCLAAFVSERTNDAKSSLRTISTIFGARAVHKRPMRDLRAAGLCVKHRDAVKRYKNRPLISHNDRLDDIPIRFSPMQA